MPPRKKTPVFEEVPPQPAISEDETFTFKAKHVYAVLVVFAFAIGILLGYIVWGRAPATPAIQHVLVTPQPAPQQPAVTPTVEHVKYSIPTDGFPTLGPTDAPITIVEFSDFQCPYCTQWQEQTFQPLLAAYPGKIRFVYRNYPLTSIHQNAFRGAEAALCANDQNAFWKYHDKLFSEKSQMNNQTGAVLPVDTFVQWATDLGLNATTFQTCLSTEKFKQALQDDISFADSLPTENGEPAVGGTPTFFINGTRVVGAYPLAYFQQVIDAQLTPKP
jgi:protein-disulfide isomerase